MDIKSSHSCFHLSCKKNCWFRSVSLVTRIIFLFFFVKRPHANSSALIWNMLLKTGVLNNARSTLIIAYIFIAEFLVLYVRNFGTKNASFIYPTRLKSYAVSLAWTKYFHANLMLKNSKKQQSIIV